MDEWIAEVHRGKYDAAWDAFLARYRRLVFAAIRHYAKDHDDILDVFVSVCDTLREDDLRRLRTYLDQDAHQARFSTWLVAVVRNIAVDWFRKRDGRRRLSAVAHALPPVRRRIFELVFLDQLSHVEAYEEIRARDAPELSFRQFLAELRETYARVGTWRHGPLLTELGGVTPASVDAEAPTAVEYAERARLLSDALEALEPGERAALQLYLIESLPAADVARMLGLPNVKAVYNRVYRALATVRERLETAGLRKGDL